MHCSPQRDDHLRTQFQRLTVAERAHALADRTDQVDITSMGFAVKVQWFNPTQAMEAAGHSKLRPYLKEKARDVITSLMENGSHVTFSQFIKEVTSVQALGKGSHVPASRPSTSV